MSLSVWNKFLGRPFSDIVQVCEMNDVCVCLGNKLLIKKKNFW